MLADKLKSSRAISTPHAVIGFGVGKGDFREDIH
jgi:hypothetical protein